VPAPMFIVTTIPEVGRADAHGGGHLVEDGAGSRKSAAISRTCHGSRFPASTAWLAFFHGDFGALVSAASGEQGA